LNDFDNESELIKNCQNGDLKSFEMLYNQYHEPLFRVAFRMTGSQDNAKDVMQNTFIKLFKGIKNFRHESKLKTYIFTILVRECYSFNNHLIKKDFLSDNIQDLFYQPQNDLQIQIEEAIQKLAPRMRECFILFAIEGFRQNEISEMLDISPGTVKAHIFQAKTQLKKLIL